MKFIYGPVDSRRLGVSLGLSLSPYKACDFDCLYCQLGASQELVIKRGEYARIDEILDELKSWLTNNSVEAAKLNYITVSGLGEPTLNVGIKELIEGIRKLSPAKIAVITNSSLLTDPQVRGEITAADLIVPSLDAAAQKVFARINRPHPSIRIEGIIEGLVSLRAEFRGPIWLEIMLAAGINDDLRHIKRLKEAVERIRPDKVQLNSPVRCTAEPGILPVDKNKLEKIKDILGSKCEIV